MKSRSIEEWLHQFNIQCRAFDISRDLVLHYDYIIMGTIASQITSLTSVYSTVYSGADQSKHQSSASLAFVWGIHRGPHKWPVTRKKFLFDDVIMKTLLKRRPGPLFTNWAGVLPPILAKSRSREIGYCNNCIALKFDIWTFMAIGKA